MKATLTMPFFRVPPPRSLRVRRWLVLGRRALQHGGPVLGLSTLVLSVLVLSAIILLAVAENRSQKALVLQAETERFIAEFHSEPVGRSWRRLSSVWQAELPRQEALLGRALERTDGDPHAALRPWRRFMLDTVQEEGLQRDIETVLAFFRRLALCVRMGSCDPVVLRERFGDLPWRFRNQHYPYLIEAYPDENLDRYFEAVAPHALVTAEAG